MLMYEKQRHHFANKGLYSQSYGFSSSQVGCESWTIKKAEHQRIDAFKLWCWRRLLRVPWTAERSNQSKGNQPWIFIRRTDAEAKVPTLWPPDPKSPLFGKDFDAGKNWRQEEKGMAEEEMVEWHQQFNGHEFGRTLRDSEGQGSLVCCSPWGCKESDMTEWLNNNIMAIILLLSIKYTIPGRVLVPQRWDGMVSVLRKYNSLWEIL